MESKLVWQNAGERTYVLVLDAGEEAFAAITAFANTTGLAAASLTAIAPSNAPPSMVRPREEDL